jgi:hypothetical protein
MFQGSTSETTGAFPTVEVSSNLLVFKGLLLPGDTAHFVFEVGTNVETFTLRQNAVTESVAGVPVASARMVLALVAILTVAAALTLRRKRSIH